MLLVPYAISPFPVVQLSAEQLEEIPGIGADLAGKIATLIRTGNLPLHRELSDRFPRALRELRDIPGLGPKRLKVLIDRLHIKDRYDLECEAKTGKLRRIRGFGAKTEERILESLARQTGIQASGSLTLMRSEPCSS